MPHVCRGRRKSQSGDPRQHVAGRRTTFEDLVRRHRSVAESLHASAQAPVVPGSSVPGQHADWHARPGEEVLRAWAASPNGLDGGEASARLVRFGPNTIALEPPESAWRILRRQFASVVVALLVVATALAAATGDLADATAIAVVLALNVALGFTTELRARRAMEALLALQVARAVVVRDGKRRDVPAGELVPGDVIVLEEGMAVPADARLLHATELQLVEAPLTGESAAVPKRAGPPAAARATLPDRATMVYAGTTVASGIARAVVVATGMGTEVGRVGSLTRGVGGQRTPLELRLGALGRRLALIAIAAALLIGVVEWRSGVGLAAVIATVIAVAIAAVPEGLPAVVTIAMAVGVRRMARRHAIVRHLATVESIGETTVVCTDKTGTLTVGEMTVTTLALADREYAVTGAGYAPAGELLRDGERTSAAVDAALARALRACVLANRADVHEEKGRWIARGDPTEAALLVVAAKGGMTRATLAHSWPEVATLPFSSERMLMATVHRPAAAPAAVRPDGGDAASVLHAFVKGAPARVLARCALQPAERARLLAANEALAARGLRVLALAERELPGSSDTGSVAAIDRAIHDLAFIGFVGMTDPPAPGVRETIARFEGAGIRTLMLTGDQRATAEAVARNLGLLERGGTALDGADVDELPDDELQERIGRVRAISRVSPEAKLRIVRALQARGDIVTMLGDGVNDAPALRQADVGVAMGGRGTDVAKEAADIVLEDDRFETIGVAVEEGRAIFDNVRRFVFYLLACNLAEIATLAAGGLVGAVAPLLPLQILWLNLATDTTPALALALEPAVPGAMARPPRKPGTSLLPARMFRIAIALSILMTAATLLSYVAGAQGWAVRGALDPGDSLARGRSYAFMTIAFAQLWLVGAARWSGAPSPLPDGDRVPPRGLRRFTRNPWAWAAVVFTTSLQVVIVYFPPIATVLQLVPLGVRDWELIVAFAAAPAIIASVVLHVQRWRATVT